MITQQDIVFASLMGVSVNEIEQFSLVQNQLDKHVLPSIPFFPFRNETGIQGNTSTEQYTSWQTQTEITEEGQFFPISFSLTPNGTKWTFPFEPAINITSGNNVVMRNVAKQGKELIGTIKERWSRKDFEISIAGVLVGKFLKGIPEETYPKSQMIQLFEFLKHHKEIYVYCYPLQLLNINKVVILDYDFPFTKGENVQAFSIKCVSDYSYNLLVKK